ncbi:MAG: class I SAM-dependent methyltransferase [Myxococcota bacterium]|nr:class I SAM-dependent methyltransferase [Myxococcota bacterium]
MSPPRSFLNDGEHYDACHASRHDDLLFWIQMASSAKSVLELGCGTGRIAIPLAVKGSQVTGIDTSESMLAQARRNARGAGVDLEWVHGDMRTFELGRDDFDLVVLAFNGLNALLTLEDALACLRCARRHLAPTGRLVLDTFLPSPERLTAEDLEIDYTLPDDAKITIKARRSYDPAAQLRSLDLVIASSDGSPPATDRQDVHVYYPSELSLLVHAADFDVVAMYGGYDQRRLDALSRRCIFVCTPLA